MSQANWLPVAMTMAGKQHHKSLKLQANRAVRLIADRTRIKADRNDLSYVRAEIIDSKGNIVPDADEYNRKL